MNIARPRKIKEGYSRPVWSEDSWLQKYAGKTEENKEASSAENATNKVVADGAEDGTKTTTGATDDSTNKKPKGNPQIYMDIKVGKANLGRIIFLLRADVSISHVKK